MKFAVVDIETTGLSPKINEIIEVGAVIVEKKDEKYVITKKYETLIKPYHEIPPIITHITGINTETVKEAPRFHEIAADLIKFIGDAVFVAHNVLFDLRMINISLERYEIEKIKNPSLDSQDLAALAFPTMPSHRLSDIINYLDIKSETSHRALADAEATGQLLIKSIEKLAELPPEILLHINRLIAGYKHPLKDILAELQQERFRHFSAAELAKLGDWKKRTTIFNKRMLVSKEKDDTPRKIQELPGEILKSYFGNNGKLKEIFPFYEHRQQQEEMALKVLDCFNRTEHLLIEAGTGTGKSLAYLLPTLLWIKKNGGPIVISTRTKNLQEQLLEKDLPRILQLFPAEKYKLAVLKGRSNYICLRRFEALSAKLISGNSKEILKLLPVYTWLTESSSGDLAELHTSIEKKFRPAINSDHRSCSNEKCPYFKGCFLQYVRKEAKQADLLIVNHSLVFTDIASNSRLLPQFEQAIFDEAHAIEEAATEAFAVSLNLNLFTEELKKIDRAIINAELPGQINLFKENIKELFFLLANILKISQLKNEPEEKIAISKIKELGGWPAIDLLRVDTNKSLQKMFRTFSTFFENFGDENNEYLETKAAVFTLQEYWQSLQSILDGHKEQAGWLRISRSKPPYNVWLEGAPIDVSNIISKNLLAKKKSVILTSATLTVNNSFSYYQKRLGINDELQEKFLFEAVGSPFDYNKNMLLALPEDILNVAEEKSSLLTATEYLMKLFEFFDGRSLVLFTSYRMLEDMHRIIRPLADELGFSILCQGLHGSPSALLKRFQNGKKNIIFGTSSFWEGIDLAGDKLSFVVIMKLPFSVPTDPLYVERSRQIEEQGDSAFFSYAVPQAVIRFKQGIGRLIRSDQDKGVVMILDERVHSKNYGKMFMNSLPTCTVVKAGKKELLEKIRSWF